MRRIGTSLGTAILALAFGLRVYHLNFQASMSDDALGLMLAQRNPLDIFSLAATEPFPPTFYVSLSVWTKLAGSSELAGRFFSLLFSLMAVALMYRAGRRLIDGRAGLIAALLLAINPLDIFFAQEVRMYSMVTLFSLASSYCAYELLAERSRSWLAYVLSSLLAVMTHAFALLVLFAHAVSALIVGPRDSRWLRNWAACQLGVLAIFGAWVLLVAGNLASYRNALVSAPAPWEALWRSFGAYALGFTPGRQFTIALPALLLALAVLGGAWLAMRPGGGPKGVGAPPYVRLRAAVFTWCYLLVPVLLVSAISAIKPAFYERYMVVALPAALLLAAAGIAGLSEGLLAGKRGAALGAGTVLAGVAVITLAVTTGSHLRRYYNTVPYARSDDMRALASYVSSAPNPVVVTNVAEGDPLYGYYLPRSLDITTTHDMADPTADLSRLAQQHPVIWFLPFGESDVQRQALGWLSANTYPAAVQWFGNAQVLAFATPAADGERSSVQPAPLAAPVRFGEAIELTGVGAPAQLRNGLPVDVVLGWQALANPGRDLSVFLHLLDQGGHTVSQHDGWPSAGSRPTSSWQPGDVIDDRHGLLLPPSLPAGTYRVEVGLYDASGQRLRTPDGKDSAIVGSVQVG